MADLHLVRDVLDKQVVDRNGHEMGRVDGVVLDHRAGAPPRVVAIEIGPSVLARRVHPALGRWAEAIEHALNVDAGRPLRIPFSDIIEVGDNVKVDRIASETSAATVERRLRAWIAALPEWS